MNEMTTCPKCGKMVIAGTKFCMYCGTKLTAESAPSGQQPLQSPQPQPVPQKKSSFSGVLIFFMLLLLAAGGYFGYRYYMDLQEKKQQEIEERELEIADSLENVRYEEQLRLEKLKLEEEHRIEDLNVFIASLYSCRGEYREKILKHYSSDLRSAYKSWSREDLEGPQALFFDKKWDDGCSVWVAVRNFKKEIVEASSPTDSIATVTVNVRFALYGTHDDEPYLDTDTHKDEFYLIYEGGEWKIDDFIRDGKSAKKRYRENSSDYGREIC